jgi:acetyltransferase-like isoleucine patch superfamily enzyme
VRTGCPEESLMAVPERRYGGITLGGIVVIVGSVTDGRLETEMKLAELYYKVRKRDIPYYARYPLWLTLWKPIRKFFNVVLIPNVPFSNLRVVLYRILVGYKIGESVFIGMKCYLDDVEPKNTVIEDDVTISYGCYFALHGVGQGHSSIHIKRGAYIGMRAAIIAGRRGISIGENSIVGASSLVNASIPPNAKAVGVPARVVASNDSEEG